jgi:hypothetical protein
MPSPDTERLAPRLKEMMLKLATSFPDMKWRDIYAELEKRKRENEYLGKPGTTQKHVAEARKGEPSPEERPWRIDMVGEGHSVTPDALADVMSAWRWHTVGQGVPFTVRMAKWVTRLRLFAGTEGLKKTLSKYMSNSANTNSEEEVWDGLVTLQSLRLLREAIGFASEELACVALNREFDPTSRMVELAWDWLDQSADRMKQELRVSAKQQIRERIDLAGCYKLTEYQVATTAQIFGWNAEDWSSSIRLDPLDELASEVLNMVIRANGTNPRREVGELVIASTRKIDWEGKTKPEKYMFVKQQLFNIKKGRRLDNG